MKPALRQAIFGSFDGVTSCLGVIAGLAATHTPARHILVAAIGLAIAATIGMGAGEYLSDPTNNIHNAWVMAAATCIGSLTPALPFTTGNGPPQAAATGLIVICAGAVIGNFRGYRLTFGILAVVAALTILLSIAVA